MTREGYAYEPVELIIHKDKKSYGCQCYAYKTHDGVVHLIQCDQCGDEFMNIYEK